MFNHLSIEHNRVNEGEGLIVNGDPTSNQDLTQEYTYIQSWGIAVMVSSAMGVYTITG